MLYFIVEKLSQLKKKKCFHRAAVLASRCYSHGKQETDEEFDARWITYFSKPDIDAWELRKGTFVDESEAESLNTL